MEDLAGRTIGGYQIIEQMKPMITILRPFVMTTLVWGAGITTRCCKETRHAMRALPVTGLPAGLTLAVQVALGIQGRHAAGTGGGDGLAVDVIRYVPSGKSYNFV